MRTIQSIVCLTLAGFVSIGSNAALLSPTAGAISEVMIAVPPDDVDENDRLTGFATQSLQMIARALGPHVTYLVHGYAEHQLAIEEVLSSAGAVHFRFAPSTYGNYTRWVRDMFLVGDKLAPAWILPGRMPRLFDDSVGAEVASHIRQPTRALPFTVDGGNIIAFDRWVFAGKDLLLTEAGTVDENRRILLQKSVAPNSSWIWVGNDRPGPEKIALGIFQPLFHIDMFITPLAERGAARPHLVVGSTALADRILGYTQTRPLTRRLDEVADHLRVAGFSVSRIPLLLRQDKDKVSVISYNNVLVSAGTAPVVLLPRFGVEDPVLAPLDNQATNHFRRLGYAVRQVRGPFLLLAQQLGGLRCLVQVTARR